MERSKATYDVVGIFPNEAAITHCPSSAFHCFKKSSKSTPWGGHSRSKLCERSATADDSELGRGRLVDGARPRVRRAPSSSSRNEPSGRVENLFFRLRANERGIECRFGKSPLLPREHAQGHVAIFVEGQCSERASYNADGLAADELDSQAGHAHALPRQDREGMLTWILQHPGKSRVRKAIEDAILSDEKST